jgi:hypothetical protein
MKSNDMVKVRVLRGSLLIGRERAPDGSSLLDHYAHVGDVVEMPRADVQAILNRRFTGYPTDTNPHTGHTQVAKDPMPWAPNKGEVHDSPIEIVE